jgi:hypothetical protein
MDRIANSVCGGFGRLSRHGFGTPWERLADRLGRVFLGLPATTAVADMPAGAPFPSSRPGALLQPGPQTGHWPGWARAARRLDEPQSRTIFLVTGGVPISAL